MNALSFAFVLDQQVGLRTQALNIERIVRRDSSIAPTWVPVRYDIASGPLFARLPGLPQSIRGTMAGVREIRNALTGRRFDGALWATWAAKSVPDLIASTPAFLLMDMTPVQMERMGDLYGYTPSRARFLAGWKRQATERLYSAARHLFAWSEWGARSLREEYGLPAEKVTALAPGVNLSVFYPNAQEKPDDGVVRLLFVGGDFVRKGGDLLLKWARETSITTPWELHIVTREPVPTPLPPQIFTYHGMPNNSLELASLYRRSDLFVLPTRADCYSLVSMEAMASGLPVVTTRLGGIPEIVTDGQTGVLVAPDDFDALAHQLDRLVEDRALRARMSQDAYSRAVTHFDAVCNVERMLERMRQEVLA